MARGWQSSDLTDREQQSFGITTGSCFCAAACASLYYKLSSLVAQSIEILSPQEKSILVDVNFNPKDGLDWFEVVKDSGDDPDITDKSLIRACCFVNEAPQKDLHLKARPLSFEIGGHQVYIYASDGVGEVSLAGLKVEQGYPAINPGPQEMLIKSVQKILRELELEVFLELNFVVQIVDGERLAEQTFNPKLGITGGLSILGTTGFVRPLSEEAWIDSIFEELHVAQAFSNAVVLTFGGSSEKAAQHCLHIHSRHLVQMINFVGRVFDEAVSKGTKHIIVSGQPAKLTKLAGAIMNTNSKESDAKKEIILAELARMHAPYELIDNINQANTIKSCVEILAKSGYDEIWSRLAERIKAVLVTRAQKYFKSSVDIAVVFIDSEQVILGASQNLEPMLEEFVLDEA